VNGVPKRIIGVALTGGASGLLVDDTTPTFISPASIVNVTFGGTTFTPLNSHFVAVPPRPDLPGIGGADPLKTWIVATTSPALLPAAVGQLFLTIDGGATWQPWHGNGTGFDLPNVPVFSVRWDPTNENVVWVGTELGVYRSTDAGLTWARYGTGLPLARVYDLSISRNGCLVRAAAYGRGLWEVFPCSEPGAAPGNGDSDRDGLVDFFDVASLAIRLGKAPSTPADPFDNMMPRYDANLDLTGNPLLLEEADLGALVAKIGGQP
jgi:hypothetical protein